MSTDPRTEALPLDYRATFLDQHSWTPFLSRYVPQQCERRIGQGEIINVETGELRPHMCGANTCTYCLRVKRRQVARAVGAADSPAHLTLTQAGEDFSEIQRMMRNLSRSLSRSGWPMEWAWVVECNKANEQNRHEHHVHAVIHGSFPPQWTLAELAQQAGFGPESHISPEPSPHQRAGYLWRKNTKWRALDQSHRLWMNGGRLQHSSRYFWRVNGEPVAGMDEAIRASRA